MLEIPSYVYLWGYKGLRQIRPTRESTYQTGESAETIWANANYIGVSEETYSQKLNALGRTVLDRKLSDIWKITSVPNGTRIKIDNMIKPKEKDEFDYVLEHLENVTGRKGLTIILK